MRKFFLTISILLFAAAVYSQVQEAWLQIYNTPDNSNERPAGIAVDATGNSHVLTGSWANPAKVLKYGPNGDFLWIADVGYSPQAITLDPAGNVYVATNGFRIYKLNSTGSEVWVRTYSFDGIVGGYNEPSAIKVDNLGNVYVSGRAGASTRDATDYGTVKFNSAGVFQWARIYNGAEPGTGEDYATDLALDAAGNIYVTGTSQLNGELDIATVKYNPAGTVQWIRRYDGDAGMQDFAGDIVIDANDNIYVSGMTETEEYPNVDIYTDIALIKYNTSGDEQWVRTISPGTHDRYRDMLVDGSGNIFIDSYYEITAPGTLRVTKINSAGVVQWSKNASPSVEGRGSYIAKDASGNIYVTGTTRGDDTYADIVTIKFNTNGDQKWMKHFIGGRYGDDAKNAFLGIDANENIYMTCIHNGLAATRDDVITFKLTQCEIVCPQNITVNNDEGQCGAIVTFPNVTTTGYCGASITYSHNSGNFFAVGNTTVTVTSVETGASCTFTITVNDNEKPKITTCPSNKNVNTNTGACYATVNVGTAIASDNCPGIAVAGERSDGFALNANYPVGITTITWTATDASGNTEVCTQTVTVVDNIPPTITGQTASTYVLSPPNHTMRDVSIDYIIADNCGADTVITVTSNEPVNGVGDGDTDPDWIVIDKKHFQLRAERAAGGTGRIYYIEIKATDPSGNTTIDTIEVRVPLNIKNPNSGQAFKAGSTVSFEGEFWNKPGKTHTAKWLLDGAIAANGIVTESNGNQNGKVTGSYKFNNPGVYKLQMNVTDQSGVLNYANTNGDIDATVVIYDPNGGHAFGGGWYNSPQGALVNNPTATGKVSFGFAVNYRNAAKPKGETQFEFKVGSFEFNALNFEYLSVSNSKAQFRGTGKIIGGQSGVNFIMTVSDGALDGSGVDKIRMKIFKNGQVYYDNQGGASDADNPTTAVGANSIIYIQGTPVNSLITNAAQKENPEETVLEKNLDAFAFPNPSNQQFTISINSNDFKEKITMQIIDMYGRVIESRNVNAGSFVKFGEKYNTGTYFVRVMQGKEVKELKLVKLN
jgi:hypothetical protein